MSFAFDSEEVMTGRDRRTALQELSSRGAHCTVQSVLLNLHSGLNSACTSDFHSTLYTLYIVHSALSYCSLNSTFNSVHSTSYTVKAV